MAGKIFISYRREDTASIAHAICQYLQREFGGKNVFIDVDMRAGVKFPKVLENRLSQCKVLLVLIGPRWLDAQDKAGNRRLDQPNDWVRLEIVHALKRDIKVIPVCVEGADLPEKATLPVDIQELVDHQLATVTNTGFRNEMAGLARDIRVIPEAHRTLKRVGYALAATLLITIPIAGYLAVGLIGGIGVGWLVKQHLVLMGMDFQIWVWVVLGLAVILVVVLIAWIVQSLDN